MVEQVPTSQAPEEDLAKRVFELLSGLRPRAGQQRIPYRQVVSELKRIGSRGIGGFVEALRSPHSPTRAAAAAMLGKIPDGREPVVELLKRSLRDPSRKVRRFAVDSLMDLDVEPRRRREEFVPLVLPLLRDPSQLVRRRAAYRLGNSPGGVSIDAVARALLEEPDPPTRKWIEKLLRRVLRARQEGGMDR